MSIIDSRRINRLINLANPRAPKSIIASNSDALTATDSDQPSKTHIQSSLIDEQIEVALELDCANAISVEDYILDCDSSAYRSHRFMSRYLFEVPQCRVLPNQGDLITSHGELLAWATPQNVNGKYHNVLLQRRFKKGVRLSGNSFNLIKPYASNYYHWLLESLPIIRYIKQCNLKIDNFIVTKNTSFVVDSLSMLGVDEKSIFELAENEYLCDRLYTTNVQQSMLPHPADVNWVNTQLSSRKTNRNRRIYISRADSDWRPVANEEEVCCFLKKYNFQVLELEHLKFEDQIRLFSEASCVISPHGAGLSNLVFCGEGTMVLEIFPPRWTPLCFTALAQYIKAQYHFINAEPLGMTKEHLAFSKAYIPVNSSAQSDGIHVPIEKLKMFCERYL